MRVLIYYYLIPTEIVPHKGGVFVHVKRAILKKQSQRAAASGPSGQPDHDWGAHVLGSRLEKKVEHAATNCRDSNFKSIL